MIHLSRAFELYIRVLHYALPITVSVYFLSASLFAVCKLHTCSAADQKRLPRKTIYFLTMAIVGSYVCEAGLIMSRISTSDTSLATTDANLCALWSIVLWSSLLGLLLCSENHAWYPYYGSWILALVLELIVFSLYLAVYEPSQVLQILQLSNHALRIFLIFILLAVLWGSRDRGRSKLGADEETAPLLECQQETSEIRQETREEQKARQNYERVQKRLKDAGNWFDYVKDFSIFIPYVWPLKSRKLQASVAGVGFCIVLVRVLNVLVPRQLGRVTNSFEKLGSSHPVTEILLYIIYNLAASSAGIPAVRTWLWLPVEMNAHRELETKSYNHIMELSNDFHDSKRSGELLTAMWQGSSVISLLETLLCKLGPTFVDLVVACLYVFYLFDAYMVLIMTVTMMTYLWASVLSTGMSAKRRRTYVEASRGNHQLMYDTMSGWKTVTLFNRLGHTQTRYKASNHQLIDSKTVYYMFYYVLNGIQSFIIHIGLFVAAFYAAFQVIYAEKSVGSFVTLLTLWWGLETPLDSLAHAHRELFVNLVDAEQLLELLKTKPTISDGLDTMQLVEGQVEFENVSFSYDKQRKVVQDFTFCVQPGQTVALVGETGGGKSTILKLLFRFYDVTKGRILIDGQDIRTVTLSSLRERIGVVPQDPDLFNDTIMGNLKFAKLDATDEEVVEACKAAAIHDKILTFSDGYQAMVGERGVRLSGGEKQRIAIARAILKDPKIILLDEATSAVDTETESKIQDAFNMLSKGRTTFIIAHRLSTVVDADHIIVVNNGIIEEQGPPGKLLVAKGQYYNLWSKQMSRRVGSVSEDSTAIGTPLLNDSAPCTTSESAKNESLVDEKSADTSRQSQIPSSSCGKIFRPEAPEFVPQHQQKATASENEVGREGDVPTHDECSSRRDCVRCEGGHQIRDDIGAKDDEQNAESRFKRVRSKRRKYSKSEPIGSSQPSREDGAGQVQGELTDAEHRASNRGAFWKIPASSTPPAGYVAMGILSKQRRRRQRHWRNRSHDTSETSVTHSCSQETTSSSTAGGTPIMRSESTPRIATPTRSPTEASGASAIRSEGTS